MRKTGKSEKQKTGKMNCKILALAQQKGGVGKTTTVINLGAALADLGHKVLLVDFDPQGALSAGVGIDSHALKQTVYDVMVDSELQLSSIILPTQVGCDLLPGNIDLSAAEVQLANEPGRDQILKEKLAPVLAQYQYILIDCPPSLGLLTLNALAAATDVIIPVQTQYFALRGMALLMKTINKVQNRINQKLKVFGILPTIYDSRTTHAKEILEDLATNYPSLLLKTIIPQTIKLPDSAIAGKSILKFSANSNASQAYKNLAQEVIIRD
jgi:chromosome partitioning protein